MNDESLRKSLAALARTGLPEDTNLWPRLAARLERKGAFTMQLKWKLVWIVLLVLLGLFAVTGVAYAVYHYFNDAGLQSVSDTGLISTVNVTALPTRNPTATPPEPVTAIGESQTLEDVHLTLEWVYLMDGQQAFGFSVSGLKGGKSLGRPAMGFGRLVPEQYRGASMAVKDDAQPAAGIYVVRQIVRDPATDGQGETRTDVDISVPLLDAGGHELNAFRFEIQDEVVHAGPYAGGNVYSTRADGLEISLDWLQLTSRFVHARLCFLPPDGQDWSLVAPTIQVGADAGQVAAATAVVASNLVTVDEQGGLRCQQASFPVGALGAQALFLSVEELSTPGGASMHGTWQFNWNELPDGISFPGIAPLAAPLASQPLSDDLTVTLERAYADAARMVFVVLINSSQEGLFASSATLKDANGVGLNTGLAITSPPDDPTRFIIELDPAGEFAAGPFKGQLVVDIGTQFGSGLPGVPFASGGGGGTDASAPAGQAEVHFPVDLTVYPAIELNPMQEVTAGGVRMLLQRVKVTPSYTRIYLCYQAPSAGDWMPGNASTLQGSAATAPLFSYELLSDSQIGFAAQVTEPGWAAPAGFGRCVKLGFQLGHQAGAETLTLTIPQLEQSMPEVVPNDQLQAARQKLLAQGIDMDWVISTGQGGGGAGPVINKKPAGMTDEEVIHRFYEALGYYYPGPWIFTVEIKP